MTHSDLTKREYLSNQHKREQLTTYELNSQPALFHFNEYCIAKRRTAICPTIKGRKSAENGGGKAKSKWQNIIFLQLAEWPTALNHSSVIFIAPTRLKFSCRLQLRLRFKVKFRFRFSRCRGQQLFKKAIF